VNASSTFRRILTFAPILVAVGLLVGASAAPAFQVKDQGTAGLDGKVVMSPAAERIETIRPDGGEQVGPGSVVERAIIIHNRTQDTIEFDMDVAQVVGSNAELVVEVRHGVREGAAAWVELERSSFALRPGQQGTMLLTIRVPDQVTPGSKPFAVTATQRTQQVQTQGAGIAPQFKQVAIFILELPGDAPVKGGLVGAAITSSQKSIDAARRGVQPPKNSRLYVSPNWTDTHRLNLSATYENEGERLLRPSGRVVVRDLFGRQAGSFEIPNFTVYPEGEAAQSIELKGLPSLGLFQARVELKSEEAGTQNTTLPRFALVPRWLLVALGAFTVYWAWKLARWQLGRRREWQEYLDDVEAGPDGGAPLDEFGDPYGPVDDAEAWELDDEPERV
jgi:hypothetical protein